jgi:hypothetical protein
MKQTNTNQSVFKPIERKQKDKANTVFLKLLAKQKSKRIANPFGVFRSETYPISKEIKPGVDDV